MKVKLLFILFPAITALISCKTKTNDNLEEMARRSSRPEAVVVKTVKLEPSTFYHELVSNGKVFSCRKAVIPFKVNGTITELNIRNGQRVNAGDLLAVIEDFTYKSKLDAAKQSLEKANINFRDDLMSNYLRSDSSGLASAKLKMSRIRSGLDDALLNLSIAENDYKNTKIYSPLSGIVANLEASVFNPSQNYKNLCTIIFDEVMFVEFPVIESEYSFIRNDMPVGIIPFIDDSLAITGRITEINPQVDETGMIKVRAEFRNNGRLIDGMNVKVLIRKPVLNRLVVPKEALVIRQGKDVIFVRQDSLAIWKYVTIESENSNTVSIKDGLEPGDLVIVNGNVNLAHETVVKEQ
ncbi:MAG TPA: efflux RND transporter periplasmic adaptor subunit [Bacteroidales bacterium]|nr:efflux RND transporter periplasmic adaptor subunit [Bacteroidales bacterium]